MNSQLIKNVKMQIKNKEIHAQRIISNKNIN